MSLIDDRGRLFGRVNLIDFLGAIMLLGLLPLAYAGFLMFRVPGTTITSISPDQVVEGRESAVLITGQGIRPFIEVSFASSRLGLVKSQGLLVESGTRAEVRVPKDLPAGTYDVMLIDKGQLLFSKPAALTVVAAKWSSVVETAVQAAGTFVGLTAGEAGALAVGAKFTPHKDAPAIAEVLAVGAPAPATQRVKVAEQRFVTVPLPGQLTAQAIIRLHCELERAECKVRETVLAEGALLMLPVVGSRSLKFVIDEVRPPDARPILSTPPGTPAVASVRVRFAAVPEVLAVLKAGDVDSAGAGAVAEADRAVLTQIGTDRQTMTGDATISTENVVRRVPQPVQLFTGTLSVPAVYTAAGWTYKNRPLKVGAGFSFETTSGVVTGWIVGVKLGAER